MTVTEEPADDRDPLAYEAGDRIGVCLDIDGTVYRSGSVFIETLAFLPYADSITLSPRERRYRRTALTAVADYHGGLAATAKWQGVLTGLDALRVAGADHLSETILTTLARHQADRPTGREGQTASRTLPASDMGDYQAMRATVLEAYGALLRGKRRADVADAVAEVVASRCPVDAQLRTTLDRLARHDDTDLYLVTDGPEHIATAYARQVSGAAQVIGTAYDVRSERYTGNFDRVDKGQTVERLRAAHGWTYIVAAGDAPVDVAMARDANLFLAVDGQSNLSRRQLGLDAVPVPDSEADLRSQLTPARNAVHVPHETTFERALRTALGAVGIALDQDE
ncbi:haloacid dehalogenase-like hydrolase [Halorussus salinisoli]|uniref:haloacid dehalogenase-like hydrolase n=1 Tax=Halorussus salinisoli TaxID=2558242 RepID=UPI0010C1F3BD|nr:haloacid dehalogenase-like hydrolase [Halorussus salinisoli]